MAWHIDSGGFFTWGTLKDSKASAECNFSCTGTLSKLFSLPPKPPRTLVCSILTLNPGLVVCLFFYSSFPVGHLLDHQVAGQLD